jgi:hypothetical protein
MKPRVGASTPAKGWCPEGDLNPHNPRGSADFKSAASADFAIRAECSAFLFHGNSAGARVQST